MSVVYSAEALSGDRREAWEAVISRIYAPLDMNIGRDVAFSGEIRQTSLGDLDLTLASAAYEHARRTRRHIAGDTAATCVFVFVRRGPLTISQFGREVALPSGSFSLIDLASPFVLGHAEPTESFFLKAPTAMLEPRFRDLRAHCAVTRPVGTGIGRIAADLFTSLSENAPAVGPREMAPLASQTLDLLGLVFEADGADMPFAPAVGRAGIRRRALAYIDRRLADPELGPAEVAAAVGVSTRYLHRVFEDSERSVSAHIRFRRLQRCRDDLVDPRFGAFQIAAIARRHGFLSQSIFSSNFRKAFGVSPRDMRGARLRDEARRTAGR